MLLPTQVLLGFSHLFYLKMRCHRECGHADDYDSYLAVKLLGRLLDNRLQWAETEYMCDRDGSGASLEDEGTGWGGAVDFTGGRTVAALVASGSDLACVPRRPRGERGLE
ncbi:hypothetical protein NDU88_002675 [Pleurodeles waltl]|uniref:Uncharacterized protein n=1 Tax=Pleurodeles waltl TaxID=8319 RepID=A0AAV7UD22_PLEWA|nr:hypothetical protein NDU88_002675 [Pleurodeles waltl]